MSGCLHHNKNIIPFSTNLKCLLTKEAEEHRKSKRASSYQLVHNAHGHTGQNQELGNKFRFILWSTRAELLKPLLPTRVAISRKWESGTALVLKPRLSGTDYRHPKQLLKHHVNWPPPQTF